VGSTDSLLDAPRVALLVYLLLFMAATRTGGAAVTRGIAV